MFEVTSSSEQKTSSVSSEYQDGSYFDDVNRHSEDAKFKARVFTKEFEIFRSRTQIPIRSYADVGCGSGDVVRHVADYLSSLGTSLSAITGYDVAPHVRTLSALNIQYVHGDFCEIGSDADLVTLFDVFEHIPDPVSFLKLVAAKAKVVACHIPLDHSWSNGFRNKYAAKLKKPGHLIFMNVESALNILALSGIRVIHYGYSFEFLAPSGRSTLLSKLVHPARSILARVNPWVMSKTLGGASLLAIGLTSRCSSTGCDDSQ